jgi:NRPS condensation-like uncharacterized protein
MSAADPSSEREDSRGSESVDFPPLPADLFPLPLTPFEHYMVIDDSPSQPMIESAQAYFHAPLDLVKLDQALSKALLRNPMLACRLRPKAKSWEWVYDPDWKPVVRSFAEEPPIVDGQLVPMDLHKEPGLRVWHDQRGNDVRLYFQIHHACADGIGVRRYIIDVLFIYARAFAIDDKSPKSNLRLDRVDHERLRERGSLQQLERNPAKVSITAMNRMRNMHYFFFQPPQPIKTFSALPDRDSKEAAELIKVLRMEVEDSSRILKRAEAEEVDLNDLGLALLFVTCQRWQQKQNPKAANKRIRLLAPIDLRVKEDLRLAAANRVSYSFLGRTHQQCESWPELLRSVHEETTYIQDSHLYAEFIYGLRTGVRFPTIMRWVFRRNRNMATAVFTYLGDLNRRVSRNLTQEGNYTRVGDTLLEDVMASTCVRSNTNLAIILCQANGKICMAANWNRLELTASDTVAFLNLFADAWREWGNNGKP